MKRVWFVACLSLLSLCACQMGKSKDEKMLSAMKMPKGNFHFRKLSVSEKQRYAASVEQAFNKLLGANFNGEILVAKNGEIIFERYQGLYNFQNGSPITPETPLHIASISKTFTGMTILHLWEEGRLSLEDSLQKFFPRFPYHGITVRMLLAHRSGLPNYLHFLDDHWNRRQKATNEDVITYMETYKPPLQALPNRRFHYCNTNFMLLASILEKVTGQRFPVYMKDSVFIPLGLKHTYVFEPKDTANYVMTYRGHNPYPLDHTDCTYGDKNIYSTARDLLLWDRALYENSFIKNSTLKMALEPQSNERKSQHNYGMAWRMLYTKEGDSIIYHNGKWHGTNSVFTRLLKDTATIIIIGNKVDKRIYGAKIIASVFTGHPINGKMVDSAIRNADVPDGNEGASPEDIHGLNGYKSR